MMEVIKFIASWVVVFLLFYIPWRFAEKSTLEWPKAGQLFKTSAKTFLLMSLLGIFTIAIALIWNEFAMRSS